MKKTIALLIIAILAVTVLFAEALNLGMDFKDCEDPAVTEFLTYIKDNGILDERFSYYGIFQDDIGDYYISFSPVGFGFTNNVQVYFYDGIVEMFWFSDIQVDDDNYLYVLYVLNEFANTYTNWVNLFIDNYDGTVSSTTIMSLTGVDDIGAAVWARFNPFLLLSDIGFESVEDALASPIE